jgi:NADPH-dependent F420 reductase
MGAGLAHNFARVGRKVYIGSREADRAQHLADEVTAAHLGANVTPCSYAEAAKAADIIVLTVPFAEGAGVLKALGKALADKIVVDVTNPFGAVPPDTSGPETHAKLLPPGACLVAAWKTNFWKTLDPTVRGDMVYDVFVCGEDEAAKAKVNELILGTGFRPIDCGSLEHARVLDGMVPLIIELDARYGNEFRSGWKFVPDDAG